MTKTIAIVPTPAWREALLGDGPCGSRAPAIIRYADTDSKWTPGPAMCRLVSADVVALPLLWEGKPVPDGIARAVRAVYHHYATVEGLPYYGPKGEALWIGDGPVGIRRLAEMLSRLCIAAEVITEVEP